MPLKSVITLFPALTLTRERGSTGTNQSWSPPFGKTAFTMLNGTGSGQANRLYDGPAAGTITLTGTQTLDLDLTGDATFKDANEVAINFVKVKGLYLRSKDTNAHDIDFGPAPSNGFLGPFKNAGVQMTLVPGQPWSTFHPLLGWAVSAGSDLFRLVNTGAASVVLELLIWGTDA